MSDKEVIGKTKCLNCGESVTVKKNIRGHLYYNCSWGDGGCGSQFQSRTNDADAHLLHKLDKKEKPVKKEVEKETLKGEADPEPAKPAEEEKSFMDYL